MANKKDPFDSVPEAAGKAQVGRASGLPGASGGCSEGAQPSNTAPPNYIQDVEQKVHCLRTTVDSLYLSYRGNLSAKWDQLLTGMKLSAQSEDETARAQAQVKLGEHRFEVRATGRGRVAFVLVDNWFQVALSRPHTKALPLAYVQVASELLTAVGAEEAVRRLDFVVNSLGLVTEGPIVSRADLCVDFTTTVQVEEIHPNDWVTRAEYVALHYVKRHCSGWSIGEGGPLAARLYDKLLELKKSRKEYLKPLWRQAGWDGESSVWRLEFEYKRAVLKELGVHDVAALLANLRGLWAYATGRWLRLTRPNAQDTNQTRWPTHPLWGALGALDWDNPSAPTLERCRKERVPGDDYLGSQGLGQISSFMASRGITDIGEGLGEYLAFLDRHHTDQGKGQSFETRLAERVADKGRRFNTLDNKDPKEKAREVRREANAYRRERDGE